VNKLEKLVYDYLKKEPKVKLFVRNVYQGFFDLLPNKKNYFKNKPICKNGYFFGFHDITPYSYDDKYILANRLEIPLRMPKAVDPLTVGFWDEKLENYYSIGKSFAWNYHKGCRLQWLDSKNNILIYNTAKEFTPLAIKYDIINKKESIIDYPIDATSDDGKWATSFCYNRLNKLMPGYGYDIFNINDKLETAPNDTGIFLVDIDKNCNKLLISLKELELIEPTQTMNNAYHFVTHSLFSPDGEYISFLHRWIHDDVRKRFSRLVICKKDGSDIRISPTNGMVSHYVWDSLNRVLAYCRIRDIDGHYIFSSHTMQDYQPIALQILNSDGHQHFIKNKNSFVTDTYPDKRRYAKLFKVSIVNQDIELLVEVKSFRKFRSAHWSKHWACDLHPRINNAGNTVCFDTVHPGQRSLCFMKIV